MSESTSATRPAHGRLAGARKRLGAAADKINARLFTEVHRRNLLYNCCWEDPALDRQALNFGPSDRVVVITSAGCNALDYLLAGAGEVNAVDMNPIQNALLELKVAGIKSLDHSSFFELFGKGRSERCHDMYQQALRPLLSPAAQTYWDRYFSAFFCGHGWRKSFFYRGTSGLLAKLLVSQLTLMPSVRRAIRLMLDADSVDDQRCIYERLLKPKIWTPWIKWFLARDTTLQLAGVPRPQRLQIVNQYPGGVVQFIRDCLEAVLTKLPFKNNYFWRVYIQGYYEPDCCPEYLIASEFDRLKAGLVDKLHIHTSSVTQFLQNTEPGISKFILLDHMDWMSLRKDSALSEEWNAILEKASPGARAIFRSAGLRVDYLEELPVTFRGQSTHLGELLNYHRELADQLHVIDRVHTYGNFSIVDLPGA